MADVKAEVVIIRGVCNAGFREGDTFLISGLCMIPQGHSKVCNVAFATITMNIGRLGLQEGPVYVCCPDPGTGEGGNVMFKLSWVKGYEDDDQGQAGKSHRALSRWAGGGG